MIEHQTSEATKFCARCEEVKPETAFYRSGPGRRESTCSTCRNEMRRSRGPREKRHKTPEERRERWLWDTYKITSAQYEAMLEAQGRACAICQKGPEAGKPLHVDHCHSQGVVRALLCNLCNLQIGVYERTHQVAVEYLAKYANGNPLLKH
ncbi:endonuclease VII domain-containing protein [Streptomyces sp. NPDC017454]|uniref:endonuclease VII domain-containing protein n=1 Tax=Streptomyces sp. NPDC017454 TaxID=3364997 RepID=UPI003796B323